MFDVYSKYVFNCYIVLKLCTSSMDFSTLNTLLTIGNIFAVIPTSSKIKKTYFGKKYKILFFVLFTICLTITLYNRLNFYIRINLIKLIIRLLADLVLILINFYGLIGIYFKKEMWKHFINNLRILECDISKNKKTYVILLISSHVVYFGAVLYATVLWINILKVLYLKWFFFELFQFYIKFYYNFIIYIVLEMILSRYKFIKKLVMKEQSIEALKKCAFTVYILKNSVDIFNEIFGWPIFFLIVYTALKVLYYFEAILRDAAGLRTQLLVADLFLISVYLVKVPFFHIAHLTVIFVAGSIRCYSEM